MFLPPIPSARLYSRCSATYIPSAGGVNDTGGMQILRFFVRGITDMNIRFENLGLYNIDTDYLRYLNGIEPEVQFTQEKNYEQKPLPRYSCYH